MTHFAYSKDSGTSPVINLEGDFCELNKHTWCQLFLSYIVIGVGTRFLLGGGGGTSIEGKDEVPISMKA